MDKKECYSYLEDNEFVHDLTTLFNDDVAIAFVFIADDSSVGTYLNSNNAPIVYSDTDGLMMVKY